MKFNFKKISAIGASLLLTGLTMGVAAAASYPEPFVSGGVADVAIVYGSGAVADVTPAGHIKDELATHVSGSLVASDGDVYQFEKTSTKFHLGDTITGVIASSLDEDELPSLLADGKYLDNDNDEIDYTQKITMTTSQLTMFEDNDYVEDEPTVGFKISSGSTVLTYTLTFSDTLLVTDMPTTNLPIMGKDYYVLSNTTTTITLLDSAEETILAEGETITIAGKEAKLEYIGTTDVKLTIDGQTTTSLAEGDTFKLSDGSYVGIKDIMPKVVSGDIAKVEFSIGSGKLKITDGDVEVQINDETISGLESDYTQSGDVISDIELTWKADNDLFVTEDNIITMPGFEVVSLSFGGLNYPAEETIEVKQGGDTYVVLENFPLKDGEVDINLIYGVSADETFTQLGKDSTNRLITNRSGLNITFDQDTDDYFVLSWSDGSDAESYLSRFSNFVLDGTANKTDFQYYKDGVWIDKKTGAKDGDTISLGNAEIMIYDVNRSGKYLTIGNNSANTNFYTLYSKEGMTVYLPWINSSAHTIAGNYSTDALACAELQGAVGELYNGTLTYNITGLTSTTTVGCPSFVLKMVEEDKNGNKAGSSGTEGTDYDVINVTLGWDTSSNAEVEVSSYAMTNTDATSTEIQDTDIWRDFTYSALATEILNTKPSSGQKSVKLIYHGDEVAADVYISSGDATMGSGDIGTVLYTDAETASYKDKNVIVVGGSCINTAAAALVGGGTLCEGAWTAATGVGDGQYIIKGYATSSITSKFALLVAGYNAADTVNAATYLRTQNPDLSAEFIGPQ